MNHFLVYFALYAAGFASGWAFFKHRAKVKAAGMAQVSSIESKIKAKL